MLQPGDTFPTLNLKVPGAGDLVLPDAVADGWAYLVFYRGHW